MVQSSKQVVPRAEAAPSSTKKSFSSLHRKALLSGVLVVLALVFLQINGPARITLSMASSAINSGDLESAAWWLEGTKFFSPSHASADFLRARVARKQGNLALMGTHLKASLRKGFDAKLLEREQLLAQISVGQLSPEIEQKLSSWIFEPDADLADILDAYANGLTITSRFEDASAILTLWEDKLPADPTPNYRRGRIEEHLSHFALASAQYRKALEKNQDNIKAKYSLARLLNLERQPEEALAFYKACDVGVSAPAAKIGMAQCLKALGESEKARDLLKQVVDLDPQTVEQSFAAVDEKPERLMSASELGCIETELGNYSDAKLYLEMALARYPRDSIARYSYAVALRGLGMSKESEENFERTRQARAALDQITVLKEKLRANSQDTGVRIKIGQIVLENESENAGIYWIESVFAYDPTNEEAHKVLVDYFESQVDDGGKNQQVLEYHRSFLKK